jgi:predicted RecB family nuclease
MSNRTSSDFDLPKQRKSSNPPTAIVSSHLFEAFLACSTKCFLLAAGEPQAENAFTVWNMEHNRSYREAGIKNLAERYDPIEVISDGPFDVSRALRKSGLAINTAAKVQKLETVLHAVEWIAEKRNNNSDTMPVPVRFVANNKLSRTDKLLLAFDAHVLAIFLNRPIAASRIVHGDAFKAHNVKTSEMEREVKKTLGKITTLLSGSSPPKLALNRHCAECAYQERCRKLAAEKDDLSLLVGLSDMERVKLNGKGIFSVTQFSYTFRPRRRSRRQAGRPEKYHHALKALAIREKKIHVVGTPQLKIEGTPVFFDVEGLPDRDFYYLVGLRWPTANGVEQRSFWADASVDEARLWADFLAALSTIASPTLGTC